MNGSSNCPSHISPKTNYALLTQPVTLNNESCNIPLGKLFDWMNGIPNCPSHFSPKDALYTFHKYIYIERWVNVAIPLVSCFGGMNELWTFKLVATCERGVA